MDAWKQLRAILLLPGTVTVVIPATILQFAGIDWPSFPWNIALPIIGSVFIFLGLTLMIWTNRLFTRVGHGTLAPWNPPQKLVVRRIYRHVRNPMITGVFCILLGESVFFGSLPLLGWFGFAVAVNMIYIPLVEESGLAKRFGDDYLLYTKNVPRWIPRLKPWEGLSGPQELK
jgi:protein-S-isoprenylcysteine O-methyltransferase Ste14